MKKGHFGGPFFWSFHMLKSVVAALHWQVWCAGLFWLYDSGLETTRSNYARRNRFEN
jgi:hypothetical protein